MISNDTQCNSFYVIVSGLFRYDAGKINDAVLKETLLPWRFREPGGNSKMTWDHLYSSYYDSYINNVFPEIRKDYKESLSYNGSVLNHFTFRKVIDHPEAFRSSQLIIKPDHEAETEIQFIDIYLFPKNMGVFSVKLAVTRPESLTLGRVSDVLNRARMLNAQFRIENQLCTLMDYLGREVMKFSTVPVNLAAYNPQFKMYINIDLAEDISGEERDQLLFDMGCISPVGSASGIGAFAPAPEYYQFLMQHNTIKVFRNWTALSLYDTFTRISCNFPDRFGSWETDYFHIYIYALYMKFYVYYTNSILSDVAILNKHNRVIRDEFIEFINDYSHTQISYKFLPDLVKDRMLMSMDVPNEIEKMEIKVNRINSYFQEKRETQMNVILTAITLLSIISCVKDTSDWLVNMGAAKSFIYPSFSLILQIILVVILVAIIVFNRKKR